MLANEFCPAPHLEAADFKADTEVTVKALEFREVGDKKETKGVIFFEEHKRGMVINRTNLKRIIAHHGNETNSWIGKKITLYPSETDFGGKTVPCIRVREKK